MITSQAESLSICRLTFVPILGYITDHIRFDTLFIRFYNGEVSHILKSYSGTVSNNLRVSCKNLSIEGRCEFEAVLSRKEVAKDSKNVLAVYAK